MTNEAFITKTDGIVKGRYAHIEYITKGKNGTYKIVSCVCRFLNYDPKRDNPYYDPTKPQLPTIPYEKIGRFGKRTTKKDGTLSETCLIWISKSNNHAKVKYFDGNGNEISRTEYELINPAKSKEIVSCYTKRIEDILNISQR